MVFDRFSIRVFLRVVLLSANIFLLGYLWFRYDLFFTYILLIALLISQVTELIIYVKNISRNLYKFFDAIRHEDYSITFTASPAGNSFPQLDEAFSILIERLKQQKAQHKNHTDLLALVLEHVKLGVLVLEKNGKVVLMNSSAQDLLNIPHFQNWEMFRKKKPQFSDSLGDFNFDGRKLIHIDGREFYVDLDHIELLGQYYHLISFSDLKNEIEQKEIEAWHKLIRILAHEVMNSVTPISSLSETAHKMLSDENGQSILQEEMDQDKIEDLREALRIIVRRSQGMLSFVDEYRKLTRLPAPHFEIFNVKELLNEVKQLMKPEADQLQISLDIQVNQPKLALNADRKMTEQVLINLIGNSFHALEEQNGEKQVRVESYLTDNHLIIEVSDNGPGIPAEIISSIFIPFFSTRKNGSGIGLTLSKNIMKLHRGSIHVQSQDGGGARFVMTFAI